MSRTARVERATSETKLVVELDLDGTGPARVSTGVGFYDHMLDRAVASTAASTSPCRPTATCTSTPTTPSRTSPSRSARRFAEALGDKRGIRRYGDATDPDGRGARPGGGRPLRPAVLRARRARDHDADDRAGLPDVPDQARARVVRVQRADQPARAGALRRPRRRTTSSRRSSRRWRGRCAQAVATRPADHRRPLHQGRAVAA